MSTKAKRVGYFAARFAHRSFIVDDQEIRKVGWFHLWCGGYRAYCG
jgi:hypothetical protein